MLGLIMQKWDAQRAVQDREAQFKSVEEILAEAVLSNAQLAVAKLVVERMGCTEGKTKAQIALSCTGQYRAAEVAEMEKAMTE